MGDIPYERALITLRVHITGASQRIDSSTLLRGTLVSIAYCRFYRNSSPLTLKINENSTAWERHLVVFFWNYPSTSL